MCGYYQAVYENDKSKLNLMLARKSLEKLKLEKEGRFTLYLLILEALKDYETIKTLIHTDRFNTTLTGYQKFKVSPHFIAYRL